jgi:transposase
MPRPSRFSPEVRGRAVRMVREPAREYPTQWGAITSIAEKIGCSGETLRSGSAKPSGMPASARG